MSIVDEETGEITEPVEPDESQPVEPDPDEEAAETDEPEPEPEPEPENVGPSPEELERMSKALDKEATRHANRLSEIMGDAAQILVPCELCDAQTAGFHLPVEHLHPESDLDARLLDVLKTPGEPPYRQAPNARECGTCGGYGKVLSGSKVAGRERVQCPTCGGNGYQGQGTPLSNGDAAQAIVELSPPVDEQPLAGGDADIWGSPRILPDGQENPNFGKMPQYKNPTLP